MSIIDLEIKPPRVIDKVVVGDGPKGLAISSKGDVAVAATGSVRAEAIKQTGTAC